MNIVLGHDFEIAKWVSDRIGYNIEPPFTAIGFSNGTGLKAGAVFNDYVPRGNIELTLAMECPFTRGMLRALALYVFDQLDCARLTVRTRQTNQAICDMARRAGFVREAAQKDYFGPGQSAELFRMLRKDCRWLQ